MRILTVNHEYPPLGGGGGVAHEELIEVWRTEHDVTLITSRFRDLPEQETRGRLRISRVPTLRTQQTTTNGLSLLLFPLTAAWKIWKLRREHVDICNAQFAVPAGIVGVFAKRVLHIPLVVSIHGGDIYDPSKRFSPHRWVLTRAIVRWVLRSADRIIAQSTNTAENARQLYGVQTPIDIFPLPYSQHSIPAVPKHSTYTFIGLGRLVQRKAFDGLITAFASVYAEDPQTRLVIIGEGPERRHLEATIAQHGIGDAVTLTGQVSQEEKFRLLAESHCFVLSSLHEGYGVMLQEAMECGLPIVATNHGGQTDFLIHEQNALLVEPRNPEQLASAMLRMCHDPRLAEALVACYHRTMKQFDAAEIARKHIALFTDCIQQHP
jgi:glycosyltransferase involved in cell wall biosynthesis